MRKIKANAGDFLLIQADENPDLVLKYVGDMEIDGDLKLRGVALGITANQDVSEIHSIQKMLVLK